MIKNVACIITLNRQRDIRKNFTVFKNAFPKFDFYNLGISNNNPHSPSENNLDNIKVPLILGTDGRGNNLNISNTAITFALGNSSDLTYDNLIPLLNSFTSSCEKVIKSISAKILFTGVQAVDEEKVSKDATEYIRKHFSINTETDHYYDVQMRFTYLINELMYCNMQIGNLRKNDNQTVVVTMDTNDRYIYNKNKDRSANIDDVKNVIHYSERVLFDDLDDFRKGKGINVK